MTDVRVRQARPGDVEAIRAFTAETWTDREDYLGDVVDEWIAGDDETQHTLVAEDGEVAGVVQTVLLSDHESWQQGMRVAPGHRGEGVATALSTAGFEWARDRGAAVARAWVFGWNEMGLGLARAAGFEPATEFRFVHPDPDPGAETGSDCEVTTDPDAGWAAWRRSAARDHLRGLAMDAGESWAVSEATRDDLARAADERALLACRYEGTGTRAVAARTRQYERDGDHRAEYGLAAWPEGDADACADLLAAVRRDAAELGADETRVLVPETAGFLSDAAVNRAELGEHPHFAVEADLTA